MYPGNTSHKISQILGLSSDARDSPTLISAIASMSTKFDPNNAQNLVEIEKQYTPFYDRGSPH
ncbi:hypothetical protein FRB91_010852 [Serendipita sp. 411]|nr:hypothetical protein FRB91_010852 [Serendipita sp. 411]